MKLKKLTSLLLAIGMSASLFSIPAMASDDNVIFRYENTFDNGLEDLEEVSTDEYSLQLGKNVRPDQTATVDGNNGIRVSASRGWGNDKAIRFKFPSNISTKKVHLGFKFSMESGKTDDFMLIGMNLSDSQAWEGGRMAYFHGGATLEVVSYVGQWNAVAGNTNVPLTPGEVYQLDVIMDFDQSKVFWYLGDDLIATQSNGNAMGELALCMGGRVAYFDDLVLEQVKQLEMKATGTSTDLTTISVGFTDAPNLEKTPDGFEIVDLMSGQTISARASGVSGRKLILTPSQALENGGEYILKVPAGVTGICGGVAPAAEYQFNTGEGRYVKSIRLYDYQGNERYLEEKNGSDIQKMVVTFNEAKYVSTIVTVVTLTDSEGNTVAADMNVIDDKIEVIPQEALYGDEQYTLTVPKNKMVLRQYDFPIATSAGKTFVTSRTYTDGAGQELTDLSGLSAGDTVNVNLGLTSSSRGECTGLASASLWSGIRMIGYDFVPVTFAEGNRSQNITLTLTVTNPEKLKVKSFLWKGLGQNQPLETEVEF